MSHVQEENMVKIPRSVFESADSKEELEDWLLAHDPIFIREMERVKSEESGKGVSLDEVAKKWNINL